MHFKCQGMCGIYKKAVICYKYGMELEAHASNIVRKTMPTTATKSNIYTHIVSGVKRQHTHTQCITNSLENGCK